MKCILDGGQKWDVNLLLHFLDFAPIQLYSNGVT
jgi:hypothetical protein